MANTLVPQGTLNRLRASVVWNSFPGLNVTASFLGREGVGLSFDGQANTQIETMTGAVNSPEAYVKAAIRIALLKTQALAAAYKAQMEQNVLIGDCTIRADASSLPPFQISNCSLLGVDELVFNGEVAGFMVRAGGYWLVNSSLFDAAGGLDIGLNLNLAF